MVLKKQSTKKKKRRGRIIVRCGTCNDECIILQPPNTKTHACRIDVPFGWSLLKKDSYGKGENYSMELILQCPDCRERGRKK